jgi:2'-5' RNA ligase
MGDVMRLRAAYDPVRLCFPIEITVVGSSGLGWFSASIASDMLVRRIREVAKGFSPFAFRFGGVACFPSSNVYYLQPTPDAPFHALQAAIGAAGLSFEPTPYSYAPHCTIVEIPEGSSESVHKEALHFPIPDHEIRVTSVSLYTVDRKAQRCYQHERFALGF